MGDVKRKRGWEDGDRTAWWVALALLAGASLRLLFILYAPRVTGDSLVYGDIAKNLLQHGTYGFSRPDGMVRPTLLRLPGYPIFLAGCFHLFGLEHYRAVMFTQAALDLVTCGLVAGTARRLFGDRAGWVALWVGALCPFTANYVAAALTETCSLLCVAATFYGLVRWIEGGCCLDRWAALVAAALGYAVLLRPEQGLLAAAVLPVMAGVAWRGRRRLGPVLVVALLTVLPLAPWAARNWHTFHVVEPLAPRNANDPGEAIPFGFQSWFRTWAVDFISTDQVYWHYDSDPILTTDLPSRAFDSEEQHRQTAALLDDYNATTTATAELDSLFAAIAAERVRAHPGRTRLWLPLARLANMLFRPRTELFSLPLDWWRERGVGFWVPVSFGILNLLYFALAARGLMRCRPAAVVWAMGLFCLLRCGLLVTLDNSEPRYTLELFPVLFVWGAACVLPRRREPSAI